MLRGDDIRRQLQLPHGTATDACAEALCDRKLSVEPVIRPLLESALIPRESRDEILTVLRLFRAGVRGIDDLLDASHADPNGRVASWMVHGRGTTAATAVALWERAVARATGPARRVVLLESRAMLAAACLEERARREALDGQPSSLRRLRKLELSLRDKEIAYWRLIAGLVRAYSRSSNEWHGRLQQACIEVAHAWQLLDDARDFESDLADCRLGSFMIDLLDGESDAELLWPRAIHDALARDAARIQAHRERRVEVWRARAEQAQMRIQQLRDGLAGARRTANTPRVAVLRTGR